MFTAALILAIAYIGIAFERLPKVNIDRPSAAFSGAVLMVLFGVLTVEEAIRAIDFNTIGLLLGMMVLVSALQVTGFFNLLVIKSLSLAGTPRRLLLLVIVATAISSAFFVNDVVVLLFTPIVLQTCRIRKVNPVPYLIAEAMASNIGSTATIVGNPQNMLIGITSGISFSRFFMYLFPVAFVSTVALILVMYAFYNKSLKQGFNDPPGPTLENHAYNVRAIMRLVPILVLVVITFFISPFLKLGIPLIALSGATLMLIAGQLFVGQMRPSTILKSVDWTLLLFFAGLFVIIEGAHKAGVLDVLIKRIIAAPDLSGIASLSVISTLVSQLVSNVPLTMLVIPVLKDVPGDTLWIALAAGSTLGGNLTIIGAVANIIVAEGAEREGIQLRFVEFLKGGAAVTAVTVALAILILSAEYKLGWLR
ncbi:MAG: anion transporter [Chloroflexi bacterium]|nr:anion transporter [Chloroflexota bacterium]